MSESKRRDQFFSILVLVAFFVIALGIAHVQRQKVLNPQNDVATSTTTTSSNDTYLADIQISTQLVPGDYLATPAAALAGHVETFTYQTKDYTLDTPEPITKTALVYLPAGYDADDTQTYNIIYWLHGWEMTNNEFFRLGDDGTVHLLDHLIASGEMPPTIVVSLTFDRDNQAQTFERSVEEVNVFAQEVRRDLIPALESEYRTYAESTASADLIASRQHRAFSGFSLGAVATWDQFIHNLDLFQYFLPISADCWALGQNGGGTQTVATVDLLQDTANIAPYTFHIIQTNGTRDLFYEPIQAQIREMAARPLTFNTSNLTYLLKTDGEHDMIAIWEMVYNGFPRLFR